ncbi:MAG: alpha/beta hydrolase [Candidatus Dormiibacter spiritus]|nr:MAG: alpha/beta hydrolase [Candidatus Dormibacteraeota bacterium]
MPGPASGGLKAPVERTADLDGPARYLDFGGAGQPLVLLHGLGGAAENWLAVGAALTENHRVLAPDLRGHGRTPLSGHPARVNDHQRYFDAFLRQVAGAPALVVGNSMGGLISVLQAARQPVTVSALLLVDPALPWAGRRRFDFAVWAAFGSLLLPGVAGRGRSLRRRRLGAERTVRESLAMICADPDRVPQEVIRAHVDLSEEQSLVPDYSRALVQSGRSILRMLASLRFDPIYRSLKCPVSLIHGDHDRLVPVEFSLGLAQRYDWPVDVLPGVGHVPMMEVPDLFSQTALRRLRTPALRSA